VIAREHNDHACLGAATREVIARVEAGDPSLVDLAERHASADDLAATIRQWPQRDDEGLPCDGPKVVACRPPQRLRFDARDPNCFERAAIFVGAAELIDPESVYRLATVDTPNGLHTFPTRDGEPVILDPLQSRNALRAGLFRECRNSGADVETRRLRLQRLIGLDETRGVRGDLARARAAKAAGHTTWVDGKPIDDAIATYERALATYQARLDALEAEAGVGPRNAGAGPVALTPGQAVDWIAGLALEPAARFPNGASRVRNGHRALRGVLVLRPICVADVRDVAFVLALAEREARLYGPVGLGIVHSTAHAIDRLDRMAARRWLAERAGGRNAGPFSLRVGNTTIAPNIPLLESLARVGGRIAGNIGLEAVKVKLATLGVTPPVLNTLEQELNREHLSLGPLATPAPMLGSLSAMTPEALAGRWLAGRL